MIFVLIVNILASIALGQQMPMPSGRYNAGSLAFAWQLPSEGEGYVRVKLWRDSGWASHAMIDVLERSSLEMTQLFPMRDRLQIGDISRMGGGRISRHSSHQNGLDVDLAYYPLSSSGRPRGFLEHMVRRGRLSRNFDLHRNWELIKTLHRYGKVQRIFVDRAIKREFCKYTLKNGEHDIHSDILRSIRPFPHHSNHMHVRLQCPDYAHKCVKQVEPSGGSGC